MDESNILLYETDELLKFRKKNILCDSGKISHQQAIQREIFEELGWELDCTLCSIQENFIMQNNIKITQYCFCYKAIYNGEISKEKILCKDNNNQTFSWVDINNINDYIIKPQSIYNLIKNDNNNIIHIVERIESL